MKLSIIVPAYNAGNHIRSLLESFADQTSTVDSEIILVDDCSQDNTPDIINEYNCRLLQLTENHGPAYCRNFGAQQARGDVLVFTDSDCRLAPDWLENIKRYFSRGDIDAIMGKLQLLPSNYLGDSISALGFPAGGAIGFENIWKVDPNGITRSLSSCNCAIRTDVFRQVGGFDENFPYAGGEDSFLAYQLGQANYKIKYCPDVVVDHTARKSFFGFLKWQFKRGISSQIFSNKIENKKNFLSLRLWSTKNIIRHYCTDRKFPMILFLLATSFTVQFSGFVFAKHNRKYA
jgi:GT2 family glycosyltransferase